MRTPWDALLGFALDTLLQLLLCSHWILGTTPAGPRQVLRFKGLPRLRARPNGAGGIDDHARGDLLPYVNEACFTLLQFLIVNMGGEMVYILAQRLQAQQIPSNKGQKVLCDVAGLLSA